MIKLNKPLSNPFFFDFVMTKKEKKLFDNIIQNSFSYLEFGLGGSTIRALKKSDAIVYSVESSKKWIENMLQYKILNKEAKKRLFIHYVNIGPTKMWGYPTSDSSRKLFPLYSSSVFKSIDCDKIDSVLVDGRFRVACCLNMILNANKQVKLLIHDFWKREHYFVLLKYLEVKDRADSLGLFMIKNNIDEDKIKNDLEKYQYDPR